jgi:SAM-dependent methyltransferase
MTFEVAARSYDRFMGRYSEPLAELFVELVGAGPGQRALDVGAGPGALTSRLVERLGEAGVCAIEPSAPFVEALHSRLPGVQVRQATAESIPFPDRSFDLTMAQLVVHFMADPVGGLTEMARVTVVGGTVAASVWDYHGERGPLSLFWRAARDLSPGVEDESGLAGARQGRLRELFVAAGLGEVRDGALDVRVPYSDLDDWWEPYTLGVGPAGAYVAGLDPDHRAALRARCGELLGPGPGVIEATAWYALGTRS